MQTFPLDRRPALRRATLPALLLTLALGACGGEGQGGAAEARTPAAAAGGDSLARTETQPAAPAATAATTDDGPRTELSPNELGRIMVLEYHRLGDNEGEFVRKEANFRKDIETLYARGYRPITMRQMYEGDIDLPAGTTPVVFTIDDSSRGQFYYLADGSIDPHTQVGIWDAFQKKNPAWKNGATWCVLPAAQHPSNFFSEKPDKEIPKAQREANIKKKVDYLLEHGHEICNHTLYHARLDRGTDAQVQEWIGRGEDSIRVYLPADYKFTTMALPLGMWPKNRSLAWHGSWKGKEYDYPVVLEVSGGPNVSPFDAKFDAHSVDRFIVAPGALERQLERWEKDPTHRYVSDGNPNVVSVPRALAGQVNRSRLKGKELRLVDAAAAPAPTR